MTIRGLPVNRDRVWLSSCSLVTTANASHSIISRMACCWGRISLPFGAALSTGTTSTATSPGLSRSPTSRKRCSSWASLSAAALFSAPIPLPLIVLTGNSRMDEPASSRKANWLHRSSRDGGSEVILSILFSTIITLVPAAASFCSSSRSKSPAPASASTTRIARSVFFRTCRVWRIRCSPSSPVSSRPAVSISTTGPAGSSSMGRYTGSVVVPLTGETIDTSCPQNALIKLDLPALRRPKTAICARSPRGVSFTLILG
ncbi:hypothetical protein D3C73_1053680 [compost metagenome]